jgi:hypothetical protein
MGRSEPGTSKNSKRVGPGQLGIKREADQPAGAGELAADGQGVAQEAGNRAAVLERQV